jgi:hypothetical protein
MSDSTDKIISEELLIRQVAALTLSGVNSINGVAKQLDVSRHQVRKVLAHPEYKKLLEELADKELLPVLMDMRSRIAKLGAKSIDVLSSHLDEGSLDAVKLVFKALGLEQQEKAAGDTSIQVILPGASEEKSVEVDFEPRN